MLSRKIIILLLLGFHTAFAGDPEYPAAAIPAALKEKAHAVKRREEMLVEVNGPSDMRVTKHYVITVLDANGDDYAHMEEWYDKLQDIRSIKGTLYDASGKQVKRLKQGDIQDLSAVGDGSLMSDDRMKRHAFYYNVYPYTVEYEIELKINHTFILPRWVPQEDEAFTVEQSKLVVSVPQDYALRYHSFHYNGEPVVATEKGARTYTWEVRDLKALPEEIAAPEWYRRTTAVFLAPASFEVQRYKGAMNSWEELGQFVYTLNQGRDQLPDGVKQTVHQLTDNLAGPHEKIVALYRYLQEHTRYISIQLGIGGWQTFDANYVASKGYGDCKALSNYMCALLKEAGIRANCVLVRAGEGKTSLVEDFPSSQFNHMIVCVPSAKDTTWLECTSNTLPAGYLSGFTANRPVLLIDGTGSKLVRTPDYNIAQNLQVRRITATVSEDGNVQIQCVTRYAGQQQDNLHDALHALSKEKLLERMKQDLSLSSYDVNKYECAERVEGVPVIDEQLDIAAHNYASVSGKRMFLTPNILNRSMRRVQSETQRLSDICLSFAYRDVDTVQITVPAGYTPEALPQPVKLQSRFGDYAASVSVKDNTITYIRTIEHRNGVYPASAFPELENFYNAVSKADGARIVLVKK